MSTRGTFNMAGNTDLAFKLGIMGKNMMAAGKSTRSME
jgi:hypothetical protein